MYQAGFLTRLPSHKNGYAMVFQDSAPCLQWPDRSGFAPDSLSPDSHRHLLQQYVIHVIIIASLLSFCQDSFLFIIFLIALYFCHRKSIIFCYIVFI